MFSLFCGLTLGCTVSQSLLSQARVNLTAPSCFLNESIDISQPLELFSAVGTTITCLDFSISTSSTTTIRGLHFVNCWQRVLFSIGTLLLEDCSFTNCSLGGNCTEACGGGAVWAETLNITNCSFTNCSSVTVGEIDSGAGIGGAVWAKNLELHNSRFERCSSTRYGGAVNCDSCTIASTTFEQCSARNFGGCLEGLHAVVQSSQFRGCSAGVGGGNFKH